MSDRKTRIRTILAEFLEAKVATWENGAKTLASEGFISDELEDQPNLPGDISLECFWKGVTEVATELKSKSEI